MIVYIAESTDGANVFLVFMDDTFFIKTLDEKVCGAERLYGGLGSHNQKKHHV